MQIFLEPIVKKVDLNLDKNLNLDLKSTKLALKGHMRHFWHHCCLEGRVECYYFAIKLSHIDMWVFGKKILI